LWVVELYLLFVAQRFKVFKKAANHRNSSWMGRSACSSFVNIGSATFGLPSFCRASGVMRENSSYFSKSQSRESRESLMMVMKEDFVEHYQQLLLEIMIDADSPTAGAPEGDDNTIAAWHSPSADICFKDLSLSIQVDENLINVIDKVTGRV
jgi:hypothetical protein